MQPLPHLTYTAAMLLLEVSGAQNLEISKRSPRVISYTLPNDSDFQTIDIQLDSYDEIEFEVIEQHMNLLDQYMPGPQLN